MQEEGSAEVDLVAITISFVKINDAIQFTRSDESRLYKVV